MLQNIQKNAPNIHISCFIANSTSIVGTVTISKCSSVWYNCTIRGDVNWIKIGEYTNIQDNSVIHVDHRINGQTEIGNNVTIGHKCLLHACKIHNNVLIGMGSIIMDHTIIHENSIVGSGSLVTKNRTIGPNELWLGSPAKFVRKLSDEEVTYIYQSAKNYHQLVEYYKTHNIK
ncbi:MAG: carbonic anhydrases/acetyltransferase, isoleucine patch superfamily protein [Candidatus Xenolissoclinum pacificiensis L6]|uniref:Carbonic anhydrases/acetyltransferase, isoleucine patch superfamily protein n=1 Tax=Candidatus Xenolissoclinum pacificiensis L6 TaxID=1401685 RepID=W2V2U8_9RICK|nr:MAG: carbonic anhydrases/acetyltransferase, isoleucine patch superfamily protein [Candidatus Xenolissoclinum pacificiensis L6]